MEPSRAEARPQRRGAAGRSRLRLPAVVGAALIVAGTASAVAGSGNPTPTLAASADELTIGSPLVVSGVVSGESSPNTGTTLALQVAPYPYRRWATASRVQSTPGGTFAFPALRPDRNSRIRVVLEGQHSAPPSSSSSSSTSITVNPSISLSSRPLGAGRTQLTLVARHTSHAGSEPVSAWWYTAPRGGHTFRLAAVTPTHEPSSAVTTTNAIVDPPGARFLYRVCINPPWERAMGSAAAHGPCPHHDFELSSAPQSARRANLGECDAGCLHRALAGAGIEYGGEARGTPRAAFPSASAIASAIAFLNGRAGSTALAVVTSAGRLVGVRMHQRFQTASVIKVMMLVAYLQMLDAHHRGLSGVDRSLLYPMIHISDNDAASAVLARVGQSAIKRVAHESGMSAYVPGIGWWAFSQTDAADQARFFSELGQLIPHQFYAYARELMSGIEPSQSWGFPPVARPAWRIFYKTGALPSRGLFHEAALLERGGLSFTVTVLTDGDPSMSYGTQTIEGVAERLLGAGQ